MNYFGEDKVFCPYCKRAWFNPDSYIKPGDMPIEDDITTCNSCNKKFKIQVEVKIIYNLYCNCRLNNEEHEWEWVGRGLNRYVCIKCSKKGSKKRKEL